MARGGGTQTAGNANRGANTPTNSGNRFNQLEVEERSSFDDPCNPYFLSNGDHPGLNLDSTPLIGSNYNSWSRAMSVALVAKNKICFIDGSTARPTLHDPCYTS
ncbi:Uncharacterized protein Adt_06264 [Abeliophyllum distichum]|uniref:Retrotransposon Copia-like N-terminal domain-containing protein n=1 Tax=Abeliophyllum distichum TaxID=126358 RepID=A0ABD1V7R1_9LAMI